MRPVVGSVRWCRGNQFFGKWPAQVMVFEFQYRFRGFRNPNNRGGLCGREVSRCVGCSAESLGDAGNDQNYSGALSCVRDQGDFSAKGVGHAANDGKAQT
jgi:hypothetical protein